MFKKQLFSMVLVWLIAVFACFMVLHPFSPEAQQAYQRLVSESDQAKKEQIKEEASPTQQTRDQVSKQILYKKDQQRLQSRLYSDHSDLIFDPKKHPSEFVEHFKGLTCVMQEKFIDEEKENSTMLPTLESKQSIRTLKAESAIYFYKSGQLEAEKVEVAHYLIPGHLWPLLMDSFSPSFQGTANHVQLSLFQERTFKAQGFQAIFHDWGSE